MSHVDEGTLHAYLDGSLPAGSERRALEVHLISCASCHHALEEARSLRTKSVEILEKAGPETAATAPPFDEIVARAEARSSGRATRRLSRMRALAWAATIVLAAGVGSVVTLQLRAPTDVPTSTQVAAPEGASNEREADRSAAARPNGRALADRGETQPLSGAVRREAADEMAPPADTERGKVAADMGLASKAVPAAAAEPPSAAAELKAGWPDSVGPAQAGAGQTLASRNRVAQPTEADSAGSRETLARLDAARAAGQPPAPSADVPVRGLLQERPATDSALPGEARLETVTAADERSAASWRDVTADEAARTLGGSVSVVDGLPILGYAARALEGRVAVRVLQRTESGAELEIVQWKAAGGDPAIDSLQVAADPASPQDSQTTLSVRRGAYNLRVRANVPQDTLRTLVERIPRE